MGEIFDKYLDLIKYNKWEFDKKVSLFYEKFDKSTPRVFQIPYDLIRHSSTTREDEVAGHIMNDAYYWIYLRSTGKITSKLRCD